MNDSVSESTRSFFGAESDLIDVNLALKLFIHD
jgi:hypothetical protein